MKDFKKQIIEKETDVGDFEQYVTFAIGNETYGVGVLKMQEIIGMTNITHVPNSQAFMKGVINLRGSVVPVVDIRLKFNMEEKEYDDSTVILITEVKDKMVGMIADRISDVVSIPVESIQDTPHFNTNIETSFIKGIGRVKEELIIILDVDLVLTDEEISSLDKSAA